MQFKNVAVQLYLLPQPLESADDAITMLLRLLSFAGCCLSNLFAMLVCAYSGETASTSFVPASTAAYCSGYLVQSR